MAVVIDSVLREQLANIQFQNFDFGKEWQRIVPFLQEFLSEFRSEEFIPDMNKSPAEQMTSSDGYACFMIDIQNDLTEKKEKSLFYPKNAKLPKSFWKTINYYWDLTETEDDDIAQSQLNSLDDVLMTACGYNFFHNNDFIAHWIPIHCCETWNPTFSLFMAKKLFPDNDWKVFQSKYHTTVLCVETKQMFDILAWDYRGAMWKFVNKVDYFSENPTLGADLAMQNLLKVD